LELLLAPAVANSSAPPAMNPIWLT
jgi:hypothetical protein